MMKLLLVSFFSSISHEWNILRIQFLVDLMKKQFNSEIGIVMRNSSVNIQELCFTLESKCFFQSTFLSVKNLCK